ncbi:MAG: polysaccharide lyase family 1 protein [Treponemataceae bacterium]|nr:polysaccharide lyase family 1 protein [Treponemataceae bacterium]
MNTLFKLRKAAMVVVAGLAAVFMIAGCKGDDGDGVGGGNNSSSASVTTVTVSGGSSIAIGKSVTLTATPNATPSGAYKWQVTEGDGYVTLGTSTTNKVTVTGKAAGTAKITAAVDGVTSEPYTVRVKDASASDADLVVTPGAKVTTNGWADLANNGAGMSYPDTTNIIYIGDDGYKVGSGSLTAYTSTTTKRKVFTNAIASGSTLNSSANETAAIIVLSGMVDLSDGKVSDADHSYFNAFDSSHKREHGDIVYEIGSNKAIIGVNGAKVAFGGLQIYANKCERGNIIIQNIDFWDAHGSTEYDTSVSTYSSKKASADSLVLESNGTTKDSNGYITYNCVPKNIWIDHCKFSDGTCKDLERNFNHDGSLDMKAGQYVTVSYCEFTNHDKVTLLAPDETYVAPDQRQITFHHNYYHGAIQRMPRSRGCQVHIYNNYYNDIGIKENGGYSLGPGIGSQFIVENNYFGKHQTSTILKYFDNSGDDPSAATFSRLYYNGNNVTFSNTNMAKDKLEKASDVTAHLTTTAKPWTINYTYEPETNSELPALIPTAAGTDKPDYTQTVEVDGVLY